MIEWQLVERYVFDVDVNRGTAEWEAFPASPPSTSSAERLPRHQPSSGEAVNHGLCLGIVECLHPDQASDAVGGFTPPATALAGRTMLADRLSICLRRTACLS